MRIILLTIGTLLFALSIVGMAVAEDYATFNLEENITITARCIYENGSICSTDCSANLTLFYNNVALLTNATMTSSTDFFYYDLGNVSNEGYYYFNVFCSGNDIFGGSPGMFIVNSPETIFGGTGMAIADTSYLDSYVEQKIEEQNPLSKVVNMGKKYPLPIALGFIALLGIFVQIARRRRKKHEQR